MANKAIHPIELHDKICVVSRMTANDYSNFMMLADDADIPLYAQARAWKIMSCSQWDAKKDLTLCLERDGFKLYNCDYVPNQFYITYPADKETFFVFTGFGAMPAAVIMEFTDMEKHEVWHKIFDAIYGENRKRYISSLDVDHIITDLKRIAKRKNKTPHGFLEKGLDANHIAAIIVCKDGTLWYTLRWSVYSEDTVVTRIITES